MQFYITSLFIYCTDILGRAMVFGRRVCRPWFFCHRKSFRLFPRCLSCSGLLDWSRFDWFAEVEEKMSNGNPYC